MRVWPWLPSRAPDPTNWLSSRSVHTGTSLTFQHHTGHAMRPSFHQPCLLHRLGWRSAAQLCPPTEPDAGVRPLTQPRVQFFLIHSSCASCTAPSSLIWLPHNNCIIIDASKLLDKSLCATENHLAEAEDQQDHLVKMNILLQLFFPECWSSHCAMMWF